MSFKIRIVEKSLAQKLSPEQPFQSSNWFFLRIGMTASFFLDKKSSCTDETEGQKSFLYKPRATGNMTNASVKPSPQRKNYAIIYLD